MFDGRFRHQVERVVKPVGEQLRRTKLSPDHLTLIGLVVACGAAVAIGLGALRLGLLLVVLAALPDLLDGALAKASNQSSQRGAFFDSTIDRVTDAVLLGGVAWFLASQRGAHAAVLPFAVMAVSSLISYQRAKAEALGLTAKGGLMERAERIILLCVGLLFDSMLFWTMILMLVLVTITAVQRFFKVWNQAAVAPAAAERVALRQSRRASRRAQRADRRLRVTRRRRVQ
ncbi:MAG: CDP-alcohol phosphatidyltransferase family protein [Ilumatobacteraceae bacterium]|jgi:CDP-diacylglycerol--glycerol-3-phosphate 3-phosphatidyltransferase|nr:CDP-alcohol phosphatidyltransferase family protein [Ilumatobacteraceae bacterium]MBJ7421245.1 CDP-alcohol phosphatidyltransferase family protein [Ilumatobacteraceae bacterium]